MRNGRGPGLAQDPTHCHRPPPPVALTRAHNALPHVVWKTGRESEDEERYRAERDKKNYSTRAWVGVMSQQPESICFVHRASVDDGENRQKEMFSYNTELNKDVTVPKAKSVFLIFCKTFGSSEISYTACAFKSCGQSRVKLGGGFHRLHKHSLMTENEP